MAKKGSSYIYVRNTKKGEVLYLHLINGKRISTGLINNTLNRKAAEKSLFEINNEINSQGKVQLNESEFVNSKNSTKKVFLEFIKHLNRKGVTLKTINNYKREFYRFYGDGDFDINKKIIHNGKNVYYVDAMVSEWMDKMSDKFEIGSVNLFLTLANQFLSFAYKNEFLDRQIFIKEKYSLTRNEYKEPLQYTNEEIQNIFYESLWVDKEFAMLFLFLLYTGTRISEALNIKWSDFNFEKGVFQIQNKIKKNNMEYLPISAKLLRLLGILRQFYKHEYKIKRRKSTKDTNIFVFRLEVRTSSRYLTDVQTKLGIKQRKRGFHSTRKNYAQMLLDAQSYFNINDDVIKTLIRHKDIELTKTIYGQIKAQNYIEILNKLLENTNILKNNV